MSYKLCFSGSSWADYMLWQNEDRKTKKWVDEIINDMIKNPTEGKGNPRKGQGVLSAYWIRDINKERAIVYHFDETTVTIIIAKHYL